MNLSGLKEGRHSSAPPFSRKNDTNSNNKNPATYKEIDLDEISTPPSSTRNFVDGK